MEEKKSKFIIIKDIIGNIITIILLFFALIILVQRVTNDEKSFLGLKLYIVQTGSMVPKYNIGDVILAKATEASEIQVGDDIVYEGETDEYENKTITHQVIDVEVDGDEYTFTTKGIANNSPDPIVEGSQVKGVVIYKLKLFTLLYKLLGNRYTLYFVIIVPLTIYVFFTLIHTSTKRRKE